MIPRVENENENNYKPLPDEVELKKSPIHGWGLFSKKEIPKDYILGMTHLYLDSKIIRTPLGGFYNHSKNPNCIKVHQYYKNTPGSYFYLKSLRDIKEGEELTVEYTFYEIVKNGTN